MYARQADGWLARASCILNNQGPSSVKFALPHDLKMITTKSVLSSGESVYPTKKRACLQTRCEEMLNDLTCQCKFWDTITLQSKM